MKLLTKRETEVIEWVANGKTAWEIANILDISERTVNFHIGNVKSKLKVSSRTQVVAEALRHGIIK